MNRCIAIGLVFLIPALLLSACSSYRPLECYRGAEDNRHVYPCDKELPKGKWVSLTLKNGERLQAQVESIGENEISLRLRRTMLLKPGELRVIPHSEVDLIWFDDHPRLKVFLTGTALAFALAGATYSINSAH